MNEKDRALSLVRATRRRLESMRLLRGAARGALAAAGLGVVLLLIEKATPSPLLPAGMAWWLALAGALAGVAATLFRPAIPESVAALFLDERCATDERFVTLWSLPDNPHAAQWAMELARVARVPRIALPREVGVVPVALFLLFGAGLLPEAEAETLPQVARIVEGGSQAAPAKPAAESGRQVDEAAQALRERAIPDAAAVEQLEAAIDRAFVRPEERAAARRELAKARAGDAAARERLAQALVEGAGVLAESPEAPRPAASPAAARVSGNATSSPYPGEEAFLRAYDVEVARLTRRGK